jgi:hypothetical protein
MSKYTVHTPLRGHDPKGKVTPPSSVIELDADDAETQSLVACGAISLVPEAKDDDGDDKKPAAKGSSKK